MAIELMNTRDTHINGVKIMCYGEAGSGKTRLIKTLPKPIVLSAESGLLSLADMDIPYINIMTMSDLFEAYQFLTESEEATGFQSVAIDSVSEIAEVVLANEKKNNKDARQAYMAMADQIVSLIRSFRDLPGWNVYMTAKVAQEKDEMGQMLYAPTIPGSKAAQNLPYFFDYLFPVRVYKDEETGAVHRALQTQPDGLWKAKARDPFGALDFWESADLGAIIEKVKGGTV